MNEKETQHICNKITSQCGAEYCPRCYNGCPECGAGKVEIKTSATINPTQ